MGNLRRVVYLSNEDYETLMNSQTTPKSITKNGKTIIYDDNDLYITPGGEADKLKHTLTFGANQNYVFDGTQDVVVPVFTGIVI